MNEQYEPTHKDALMAAIQQHGLMAMPTPKLPPVLLEHVLLKDTVFVRGPKSRDMVAIIFSGHGDIEGFEVPPGTLPGELADLTEVSQVPAGNPLLEAVSSADLLSLLTNVVFPEMTA
ncbi:hypothetical protein [Arthrobacter alpinus]|uniref:hypothetical protein n=1 Tax=Arthrobacter alpinus TaxID=656366 RepID=UPI00164655A3|nr:hypothetical protein [Arthrobacter alpinus]